MLLSLLGLISVILFSLGLPHSSLCKLQLVQNSLARAVCPSTKKFDHISPIIHKLHWLPIKQRISFKILLVTFKTLLTGSPSYLSNLLVPYRSSCNLRSNSLNRLTVPFIKSKTGRRSFSFAAPTLWNSLPPSLRCCSTLTSFRSLLKTHLYSPWTTHLCWTVSLVFRPLNGPGPLSCLEIPLQYCNVVML